MLLISITNKMKKQVGLWYQNLSTELAICGISVESMQLFSSVVKGHLVFDDIIISVQHTQKVTFLFTYPCQMHASCFP